MANPLRAAAIKSIPAFHHEHPQYRWWVLGNVMIVTFMSVLESTVVNTALPAMMNGLGTSLDQIEWVLTVYQLVFAVMLPLSGWLADTIGYKLTFFLSLIFFTVGSFLCSFAWSETALIIFRVIQAIGGGLIMPVGMATVIREFPPQQRGMALGFWGIAAAASVSIGPSLGGYLTDNYGWASIFLINVPIGVVAMIATLAIQREYKHPDSAPFDFLGFLSISTFLISLLLALADGNAAWNTGGWTSEFILTCFVIAGASFLIFVLVEMTVEHPILNLRLLKSPNFAITNILLFIFGLGLMGSTFLMPMYLQGTLGYSALQSGMIFLPLGLIQGLSSPISGILGDRLNPKIPAILGIGFLTVSLYLNTLLDTNPPGWLINVPIYLRGLGFGLMFTPLQSLAIGDIPRAAMAQGSSMINLTRQIGSSFGVAIFGAIVNDRQAFHTATSGENMNTWSETYRQIASGLQNGIAHDGGQRLRDAATLGGAVIQQQVGIDSFVHSVTDSFVVVTIMTACCALPLFFLKAPPKMPKLPKA